MHDVYVTGVGAITCLGADMRSTWSAIERGRSGIHSVEGIDVRGCRIDFAGQVRGFLPPAGLEDADRGVQFAAAAVEEAMRTARLGPDDLRRLGTGAAVVVGSSKGGVLRFAALHKHWLHAGTGVTETSPLHEFWSSVPPSTAADTIAGRLRIRGARFCPVAACATGTVSVIRAAQLINDGCAELVLCGAADASIHPLWLGAFDRMGVLARPHPNDGPVGACRPFDAERTGFAIGEGAGMLILESARSVRKRDGLPLARIRSWALGADPSGLTGLDATAEPVLCVIRTSLDRAGLRSADIDVITAHATATRSNDAAEALAYRRFVATGSRPPAVTALKGAIGHMLGAAGSAELALSVEMLRRQQILPTANHARADNDTTGIHIIRHAQGSQLRHILKLSLGFGGHIAAIILSRP